MGKIRTRRGFIEDMPRLTIADLRDSGFLQEGPRKGVITLTRGSWATEVEVEVCFYPSQSFFLVIFTYRSNGKKTFDWFRIERMSLPCTARYYFVCRDTHKKVSALYFSEGHFASRFAHGLVYHVCCEHRRWDENLRRFYKYNAKVKGIDRVSSRTSKYWAKAEKYEERMAGDLDCRFSKVLDRIHRKAWLSSIRGLRESIRRESQDYFASLNRSKISI